MLGIGHDGRVIGGVGVDIGGQVALDFLLAPGIEFFGSLFRLVHRRHRLAFFDPAVAPGLHAQHAVLFVAQRRLGLRIALALGSVRRIRVIGFGGAVLVQGVGGDIAAFVELFARIGKAFRMGQEGLGQPGRLHRQSPGLGRQGVDARAGSLGEHDDDGGEEEGQYLAADAFAGPHALFDRVLGDQRARVPKIEAVRRQGLAIALPDIVVLLIFLADKVVLRKHALGEDAFAARIGNFLCRHAAPAYALHGRGGNHLVMRIEIQGNPAVGGAMQAVICAVERRRVAVLACRLAIGAALVDKGGILLHCRAGAQDVEKRFQGLRTGLILLPARVAMLILQMAADPVFREIAVEQAVGRVAQHITVGHGGSAQRFAEKGGRHGHHIALAMADDGDGRVVLACPDRLHETRQAPGGEHEVRARRAGIHLPVIRRVHVLDMHPQEQLLRQALVPQIGQGAAAVGERSAAPVILFVEIDAVAKCLQLLAIGLVTPAEADHGRIGIVRLQEGGGVALGIEEAVIRQFARVSGGLHLSGGRARDRHILVAALQTGIQPGAQALLRLLIPFAVGIDAVHEDDDAGARQARDGLEQRVAEQGRAFGFGEQQAIRIERRVGRHAGAPST